MTVELRVVRKVVSYTRGIGGIGNVDWQIELECGHLLNRKTEDMNAFWLELDCKECHDKFKKEIELYQMVEMG